MIGSAHFFIRLTLQTGDAFYDARRFARFNPWKLGGYVSKS